MRLVNSQQMRRLEDRAIKDFGIPSILLMENAALAWLGKFANISARKNKI